MSNKTERLCLPVKLWPAADQLLWTERLRPAGLFDPASVGASWAPASRRKTASGYGRWLQWLILTGQYDPALPPGQRVTRERVAAYLHHLGQTVSSITQLCRTQELLDALRVLAPEVDWCWLSDLYQVVRSQAHPVRDKRQRLLPASELVDLGCQMMLQAGKALGWSASRRAMHYRDGLLIALLAYRPVRLKNLAGMRLGQHIVEKHGRYWILLDASETKNHVAYEVSLPANLEAALRQYIDQHRPVLLSGGRAGTPSPGNALWISRIGTHWESGALARRIADTVEVGLGQRIPPHWFRDAAATTIAIDNPVHVRDAHLVLGHAGLGSTEKHYNQARTLQASHRYQAMLAAIPHETKAVTTKGSP